jgi:hypothetical protein
MPTPDIAVIAHWELPVVLRDGKVWKKMLMRWNHTLKAFGCKWLILVDVDNAGPFMNDAEIRFDRVDTLGQALHLCPGMEPVYVEVEGHPLQDYEHPDKAVYIFGSDFGDLPEATVGVPTHNALHADITCGIVLYDRSFKQWP